MTTSSTKINDANSNAQTKRPMLGILGGMGPLATAFFYEKIIEKYPAAVDQDHIPTLILSDPNLPDRTTSILEGTTHNVTTQLLSRLATLESAGATTICMPCNTAHYWADDIRDHTSVQFVDMIQEVATTLAAGSSKTIGLFSTVGTAKTGIYQRVCKPYGLHVITPDADKQAVVSDVIAKVKAHDDIPRQKQRLQDLAEKWRAEHDFKWVILGCTELPLPFAGTLPDGYIDPMDILAEKIISIFKR